MSRSALTLRSLGTRRFAVSTSQIDSQFSLWKDGTLKPTAAPLTIRVAAGVIFGKSGAKFIWGGEAVAVRGDGRANARQLCLTAESQAEIASLRDILLAEHNDPANENGGGDVLIGLQLTHSGRFCKPNSDSKFEPFILYHHPLLDKRFGLGADYPVMSDDEIESLIQDFVLAAKRAQQCGFNFVDVKHCHGLSGS